MTPEQINYLLSIAVLIISYFLKDYMKMVKQTKEDLQDIKVELQYVKNEAKTNDQLIKIETKSIYRHIDTSMSGLKTFIQQQNENVMKHIDNLHQEIQKEK
jgi:tRNA A37 threonylcarbamoyltransferase TsaD